MEKHKKCKVCGSDAEWKLKGECYCEDCIRTKFNVQWQFSPRFCEMCGDPLNGEYYTDDDDNPFCSSKCALEYNGACELKEERDDE